MLGIAAHQGLLIEIVLGRKRVQSEQNTRQACPGVTGSECLLRDLSVREIGMFEGRFTGRSAVITGGASGAGRATARRLVQEGGRVCLWDVNAEALETARAQIGATHAVMVDVSDPDAVATAARQSHAALGGIDLLLCSAAITGVSAPVVDFPVDNWQRVMDINLNGVFYCCKAITPYMIERGYGRIVNLASIAGKEGNPNLSAYSAAKAGVIGLTKSLGKELATAGVLVNAVAPATFNTPLLEQLPEKFIEFMRSKIPMARFAEVDEIVSLLCWLLSEECSFSTGAVFDLSGGRATY
jgi:2-dehydro-3-deoxy-L-rhamnonate dehydrogenase (NAD+)